MKHSFWLLVIPIFAAALRFFQLDAQSFWYDEGSADAHGARLADASDVFQSRELVQHSQSGIWVAQHRSQEFDQRRSAGPNGLDADCRRFTQSLQGWR